MATEAEDWDTIIAQIRRRIMDVTAAANPDYSVAGRSISKGAYLAQLTAAHEQAKHWRQMADNGGAWEIVSRGVS